MGARMGCGPRLVGGGRIVRARCGFRCCTGEHSRRSALIVLTVIMAASAMKVAGGIDFLVRVAERIIRRNPKQITLGIVRRFAPCWNALEYRRHSETASSSPLSNQP
jgi:anaerobic C4-dicarboxylate transporter